MPIPKMHFEDFLFLMMNDDPHFQPRPNVTRQTFINYLKKTHTMEHFEFWTKTQAWISEIMILPFDGYTDGRKTMLRGLERAQNKCRKTAYYEACYMDCKGAQNDVYFSDGRTREEIMMARLQNARIMGKLYMVANAPRLVNTGSQLQKLLVKLDLMCVIGVEGAIKHPTLYLQDEVGAWLQILIEQEKQVAWLLYRGSFADFEKITYRQSLHKLSATHAIWYLLGDYDMFKYPSLVNTSETTLINFCVFTLYLVFFGLILLNGSMAVAGITQAYITFGYFARCVSGPRLDPTWQFVCSPMGRAFVNSEASRPQYVDGLPKRVIDGVYLLISALGMILFYTGGDDAMNYPCLGVVGLLAVFSFFEGWLGICLLLNIYYCINPLPSDVCEDYDWSFYDKENSTGFRKPQKGKASFAAKMTQKRASRTPKRTSVPNLDNLQEKEKESKQDHVALDVTAETPLSEPMPV